jgi:hypothetical protein
MMLMSSDTSENSFHFELFLTDLSNRYTRNLVTISILQYVLLPLVLLKNQTAHIDQILNVAIQMNLHCRRGKLFKLVA